MLKTEKNKTKYAFIHIPRTSGVYVLDSLIAGGYSIINSWTGMGRDWTSLELIVRLQQYEHSKNTVAHNHSLGWNRDLLEAAHYYGFKSFMIVRDPVEQYPSIYKRFFLGKITWEHFLEDGLGIQRFQYEIPSYYKEVDLLIPYQKEMAKTVKQSLSVEGLEGKKINASPATDFSPSPQCLDKIRNSGVYERYLQCIDFMEGKCKKTFNTTEDS